MLQYEISVRVFQNRTEYGIVLKENGKPLKHLPQLSEDGDAVCELAALLNELAVEPCHFEDVVEDYLTDFTI